MVVPTNRKDPGSLWQMSCNTISCFCWSPDTTQLALCPGNNEIHIYDTSKISTSSSDTPPPLITKLCDHTDLVTSLDWSSSSNFLISVSEDRAAFIWNARNWFPTVVELKAPRGALHVAWNNSATKFSVATSSNSDRKCHIGMWNAAAKLWQSRRIGRQQAALTSTAWHPSGMAIALFSFDCSCTIHSVYVPDYDNPQSVRLCDNDACKMSFGAEMTRIQLTSWALHGSFSPRGEQLAICCQDSTIRIENFTTNTSQIVSLTTLPVTRLEFLNDDMLVGFGHNLFPSLVKKYGSKWDVLRQHSMVFAYERPPPLDLLGYGVSNDEKYSSDVSDPRDHTYIDTQRCKEYITTASTDGSIRFWSITDMLSQQ